MSNQKIVVPEGMLKAAVGGALEGGIALSRRQWTVFSSGSNPIVVPVIKSSLEAALKWMIEDWNTSPNAIRMPEPWYSKCRQKWDEFTPQWKENADIDFVDLLVFFGNRMMERFVSQEPEVPEDIKDIIVWFTVYFGSSPEFESIKRNVVLAYSRGQKR